MQALRFLEEVNFVWRKGDNRYCQAGSFPFKLLAGHVAGSEPDDAIVRVGGQIFCVREVWYE